MDRPNVGRATILRGDALHLALADHTVDLVVTSPPYFGLRSYQDGGEHYDGQIGDEPTPAEFVDALVAATAEMVRVLKPSGSIWVNLGDKYAGSAGSSGYSDKSTLAGFTNPNTKGRQMSDHGARKIETDVRAKSLIGIPWRYALRCIDDLGLILRAEVIWSKPNGLPESVTDRVRRSHEVWFHFTLNPRYYSAVDEVREAHVYPADAGRARKGYVDKDNAPAQYGNTGGDASLGKLPGSVWTIPTQPLRVPDHLGIDHFAAFPMEFPRRIITGWSPRAVCSDCGFLLGSTYDNGMLGVRRGVRASNPQRRTRDAVLRQDLLEPAHLAESEVHEVPTPHDARLCGGLEAGPPDGAEVRLHDGAPAHHGRALGQDARPKRGRAPQERGQDGQPDRESGTAREDRPRQAPEAGTQALRLPPLRRQDPDVRDALACPHCGGTSLDRPVVADVFGGTGTTALVAKALGRHGISNDMSADYCRLAEWRTNDEGELARAMQVDKPREQVHGQISLLDIFDTDEATA